MAKNPNPNPQNPTAGNQSPAPKSPGFLLQVAQAIVPNQTAGTYRVTIKVTVFSGNVAAVGQTVTIEEGVSVLFSGTTNNFGQIIFEETGALKDEEQTRTFEIKLPGHKVDESREIIIPAKVKIAVPDNDPEKLVLSRFHDGNGNFRVHIRVLKHRGVAVQTMVSIWYRGTYYQVPTGASGEAVFDVPGTLQCGDSFQLSATVSGITDAAKLKISRPRLAIQTVPSFTRDWWIGTNNGRAFLMLCFSAFLWLFCLMIGTGEPIINDMTFRSEETGFSAQEELYNRIVAPVDPSYQIAAKEHDGEWKHFFWKLAFLITVISLIYAPLSLREEIAEGVREGAEKMLDRSDAQAGDPTFEKLIKWAGVYSVARREQQEKTAPTGKTAPDGGHPSFGTLFSSDLLSEIVVKVVPAVFKRVF